MIFRHVIRIIWFCNFFFNDVCDTEWFHRESYNPIIIRRSLYLMVLDFNIDVIVHVGLFILFVDESNGKTLPVSCFSVVIVLYLRCGRQVIHNPIVVILFPNGLDEFGGLHGWLIRPSNVLKTQLLTVHVCFHQ